MSRRAPPIENVRDISKLAYGFMATKALFTALDLDLFTLLSGGAKSATELEAVTGVRAGPLTTLLTACVSLGLLEKSSDRYINAPAVQEYLVRNSPKYFGDYYRFQIDRQIYPAFGHLSEALRGKRLEFYDLTQDRAEAEYFLRAQHAGSLGPAVVLSRQVDLSERRRLLDVAGGSGAFSIVFCHRFPNLAATVLDFPAVGPIAAKFVAEADLADRVGFVGGNALEIDWPSGVDVVLISYLLSAIEGAAIPKLLQRAFEALSPGGQLLLHDFMVDDDGTGPTTAALWLLYGLLCDPEATVLNPAGLTRQLAAAGFKDIESLETIPTITRTIIASKS